MPGPLASVFEHPSTRYSPGHRGIDLVAAPGTAVLSPAVGVLTFAGMVAGRPVVTITHPSGWRTSMEPVVAIVPAGTELAPGSTLGTVGPQPGHCAPSSCVHLGVRDRAGEYVDPQPLLRDRARVVLLPTTR